jgi:thiol-disulfide isomerase/thioredoxin
MRAIATLSLLALTLTTIPVQADPIDVKQTTFAELEKTIQSYKGKVVLVDVWSLGCTPCVKKFPSIVKLAKDHAVAGLVVITVTTDEVEDKAKVLEFLKKHDATTVNLLLKDTEANQTKYEEQFPVERQPTLWIYDTAGQQVVKDFGKLKPEQLEAKVQELLKK